jgi:hypothetical protein
MDAVGGIVAEFGVSKSLVPKHGAHAAPNGGVPTVWLRKIWNEFGGTQIRT